MTTDSDITTGPDIAEPRRESTRTDEDTRDAADRREPWMVAGGVLGAAFAVATIATMIAKPVTPTFDAPIDELRTFWEDDGTAYLVVHYLTRLAMIVLFVPFLVALCTRLARNEQEPRPLSRLVLVGGALHVVLLLAADAAWGALGAASESLSDDAIIALTHLDRGAFQPTGFTLGLFLLAAAIGIVRTTAVWRWLGYVGAVIGAASLVAPLMIVSDDPEGPLAFVGFFVSVTSLLWILLTGIAIAATSRGDRAPA